jgi:sugar-specific transcriptional regulator TrmB
MDTEDLITTLRNSDLSPYQANAYVALLDLGTASASDIADCSEVPLPRIYDVLRDLEGKGYVETYEQGPLKARAHNPAEVLDSLRTQASRFESAADEVEERWEQPDLENNHASIVTRFETVIDQAEAFIANAEQQIQLSVSLDDFESLRPALVAAYNRDVIIRVSVHTHPDDPSPSAARFEGACTEVRHRRLPAPFVALIDRQKTCFSHHADSADQYGVLVDDSTHAYVFYWYFLTCLWAHWEPIYSSYDDGILMEYADIRHCAQNIRPLLTDGATIHLQVEGRDIDTGETCSYEGKVVDVVYGPESDHEGRPDYPTLASQATLLLDTGDREVSIGGWGAVIEDIEANRITIMEIERSMDSPESR